MNALDRRTPPGPEPPRSFRFPSFEHQQLAPGVELYVARYGRAPLVSLELVLPGGGQYDPAERAGLAALTATLLDEGTERRDGAAVARAVESRGGSLASAADWDASYVSAGGLARHLGEMIDLIWEVAFEASLATSAFDRERNRRLADLDRRSVQPASIADETFLRELYGDSAYGHSLRGDRPGLESIQRQELVDFYRETLCRRRIVWVATGQLEPCQLATRLAELTPPELMAPPPDPVQPNPRAGPRVLLVDRPHATQTELRLGHVGVARRHPDRLPLQVMSCLLGGKFTSRINLNLRERHGYTYGARSRFAGRRGPGPFSVSAAVATESAGAAAREVLHELRRIRDERVSSRELDETISYLEGVFPYTLQRASDLGSRLSQLAVHQLDDDHYETYPARLHAVTTADVQRVAMERLRPDALAVIAVGPIDLLREQMDGLGDVVVVDGTGR